MNEEKKLQEAIWDAFRNEKAASDFYRLCAARAVDPSARYCFGVMSNEERTHARMFLNLCNAEGLADFDELMAEPPAEDSPWIAAFRALPGDVSDVEALRTALILEMNLEEACRESDSLDMPGVKAIYELNARETRAHIETIEQEYQRLMRMPDELEANSLKE